MKRFDKFLVSIVDDSEMYSTMVKYMLSKDKEIETIAFTNAEDFIMDFKHKPDVIILDHNLEGMNGLSALTTLKNLHKGTPIIILSSQTDIDIVIDYMNNGATDYIVKNTDGLDLVLKTVELIKSGIPYQEKNILNQIYKYFTPIKITE